MSDSIRSLVGKIGADSLHSKYDSRELTAAARAKWQLKFVDQVDPERLLPEAERLKRAEHAMRAHMHRLALASAKARARRKADA